MTIRLTCPSCGRRVALTPRGRLYKHGQPTCPRKTVGRIWPTRHHGRPVRTIPGPDTWNPNTLQGAA